IFIATCVGYLLLAAAALYYHPHSDDYGNTTQFYCNHCSDSVAGAFINCLCPFMRDFE
ncbi:unnamed protein product, partial [Ceratitis capitata]